MMLMETWKNIKDFDNYEVSNIGSIRNKNTNKILKSRNHNSGYLSICLCKDKKAYYFLIHRLVALHFIDNIESKPCVGHLDTNKLNNNVSNLIWCTYSENNKNEITIKKRNETYKIQGNTPMKGRLGAEHPMSKCVLQYDKKMNLVNEYGSVREAERITGIKKDQIYKVCLKLRKTTHKFIFKYKEYENK